MTTADKVEPGLLSGRQLENGNFSLGETAID
jgi:hypothetical protein